MVKDVCGNVLVPQPFPPVVPSPVTLSYYDRQVTYTGVSLNGGGNVATVAPGSMVSLAYNMSVFFPVGGYCPDCIVEIYVGIGTTSQTLQCNKINPPSNGYSSAYVGGPFVAPTTPGIYYLIQNGTLDFVCQPQNYVNSMGTAIGAIIVGGTYDGCEGTITYPYHYEDCSGLPFEWLYTYTVERNDFTVPDDDGEEIPFGILANPNTVIVPPVTSDCDEPLMPTGPVLNAHNTDTYVPGCEGTISYTWAFTDCAMHEHEWTYTYTVVRPDFTVPTQQGVEEVSCLSLAVAENVILPEVQDAELIVLLPGLPMQNYNLTDTYNGTFGTISFTWLFTDCAMHVHAYTYTFNVACTAPTEMAPPVQTSTTVSCYLDATPPTTLPTFVDGCGFPVAPTGPIIGGTNTGGCDGTITYTYTYASCTATPVPWVYTYNVACDPVHIKIFLEGAYDPMNNNLKDSLRIKHMLPGQVNGAFILDAPAGHHFNMAPWNYPSAPYDHLTNTGTQWGDAPLTPYPVNVVDWILVTVRKNGILPDNNVWRCAGWVMKDGSVVFPENCSLPGLNWGTDTYYIVVEHRNHLGVMDLYHDTPPVMFGVDMPCGTAVLDWNFTVQDSYKPVFRFGQKQVEPGTWAMFAANGNQLTSIASINSTDRTTWQSYQGLSGYYPSDYNMNGNSNSVDETIWKLNQNKTTGIIFY